MTSTLPDTQKTTDERWRFWRDVLVFELKMFIGNLRDFALMPVSVVAAMIDLVSKGEREGSLFYRVLRWGAHSEEVLDAYSPIRDELQDRKVNPNYTVDAVVARLEGVLVREYEKGGTAATIILIKTNLLRPFSQSFPRLAFFLHPAFSPPQFAPARDVFPFRGVTDRSRDPRLF